MSEEELLEAHQVYAGDDTEVPCWINDWSYCQACNAGLPLPVAAQCHCTTCVENDDAPGYKG